MTVIPLKKSVRAGTLAIAVTLAACSADKNDALDASTPHDGAGGDAALDSVGDATAADGHCPSDVTQSDIVPPRTTPDPDDPSCILPPPEPLFCVPQCAVPRSPVFECDRSSTFMASSVYSVLRADAQGVYWKSEDGYLRMARADAPRVSTTLAYLGDQSFAIDDDFVYFGSPSDSGDATLTKMKRDGTERVSLAAGGNWSWLTVDRDFVYFSTAERRLASVPKAGGTTVDIGLGEASMPYLEIDDTHYYWLEKGGTESLLKRKAKDSSAIETVATGLSGAESIQLQGDDILLLAAGVLWAWPKAGGCSHVVATLEDSDYRQVDTFVADDKGIYWTTAFESSDSHDIRLWHAPRWGGSAVKMQSFSIANFGVSFALAPKQVFFTADGTLSLMARN
jgi:hypothetical protein